MRFRETQVIVFANQKGGCGKTSSTVSTAAAFASLGYSVCVLDTDPQCNATDNLGVDPDEVIRGGKFTLADAYLGKVPAARIAVTPEGRFGGLISVVPGHRALSSVAARLENEVLQLLADENTSDLDGEDLRKEHRMRLRKSVDSLRGHYDVVLIDTPPMRAIRRMLDAARSERAVNVQRGGEVFDQNRHLLNCANGTVNLRTGQLRPHSRTDYITKLCPTEFRAGTDAREYLTFLARVFHGRAGVAGYVRRLSGYVATGETCDHSFHTWHGTGANGKSVLLNLWTSVLGEGEYAHIAAPELLVHAGGDRHPTERVGLRGARLVVCAESGEDGQLDEAKLKALTSDDVVIARGMRQNFFQFAPTHKIILATNHRPRVRGTDDGIWRRLQLVPFAVRFWKDADRLADPGGTFDEGFRADPGLLDKLRTTCAPGVLADMVANAVAFYRDGRRLTPPSEVSSATADYRRAEDVLGQFFQARVMPDEKESVRAADLYAAFREWWACEGHRPEGIPGVAKFGREASKRFIAVKASVTVYRVRLLEAPPQGEREDGKM